MKIKLNILFCSKALGFFLLLLMLSTRVYAQKSTTIEICLPNQGNTDAIEATLLQRAKRQAIGSFFGETISKETTSHQRLTNNNGEENFNSNFDITSSSRLIGGVYIQGNPVYNSGSHKTCITAHFDVSQEYLDRYSNTPKEVSGDTRSCADSKPEAEKKSVIALLENYDSSLKRYDNQQLLNLVRQVKYRVITDDISHEGSYCVIATANIVPQEIEMFRDKATRQAKAVERAEAKVAEKKHQEEIKAKQEKAFQQCQKSTLKKCLKHFSELGNNTQVMEYFQKSCDEDIAKGCFFLGEIYKHGEMGISQSNKKAVQYYRKACDGRDASGCTNLGLMYDNGDSDTKAAKYYRRGCDGGSAEGCTKLGEMYDGDNEMRSDFRKSYVKAVKYYRKGCKGDHAEGCYKLAYMYDIGSGVGQSNTKADKYYQESCEMGYDKGCGSSASVWHYD